MNDVDIPDYGVVFTYGESRFADNIPSHFFIKNDPIVEISCGDQHTAVVCKYGRVFSFGSNEWGQLGLGHRDSTNKPSCVKNLKPEKVKHVACGRVHSIFTTDNGKVYSCGCNTDGQLGIGDNETLDYATLPMFVTEIDEEILQVAAGSQHSVLLTAKGIVYVWGSNLDGQLGLIKSETNTIVNPTLLHISHTITQISCGSYHTGFVSDTKKLFLCGDLENDNMGINRIDENDQCILTEANIPDNIICVACGGHHTIALTDEGKCYVSGNNSFGQLGIGDISSSSEWILIVFNEIITTISAGGSHSMFLTASNILYACGDSKYGKICTNNYNENVTKPLKINFPFSTLTINKIVCGGCHTMILASPHSTSNKLSFIKEIKQKKSEELFPYENKVDKLKFNPMEKNQLSERRTFYHQNYTNNSRYASLPLDENQRSLEKIPANNSLNFENTRNLNTNNDSNVKNYSTNEKNISNETITEKKCSTFDEITTLETVMYAEENPTESKVQVTEMKANINQKNHHTGKFKQLLRCGIQKIAELKHENNNYQSTYVKDSHERKKKLIHNSNMNHVTSKVCMLL